LTQKIQTFIDQQNEQEAAFDRQTIQKLLADYAKTRTKSVLESPEDFFPNEVKNVQGLSAVIVTLRNQ
jgi:hypothetical protein